LLLTAFCSLTGCATLTSDPALTASDTLCGVSPEPISALTGCVYSLTTRGFTPKYHDPRIQHCTTQADGSLSCD
jgi:hypothetical protein